MEREHPTSEGSWRSLSSREDPVSKQLDSHAETESAADLTERLGLHFTNLHLLVRALTHRSYVNENPNTLEDNERLEFLGDAVLDFIVGAWVYNHFPEMPEGDLTRMRSVLVRTDTLAKFARHLDLGPALRLGRGELASGGRERDNLLCATFEAVIGAMYLDAGIKAVETFVEPILDDASEKVVSQVERYDPKSTLQEWAQFNKLGTPKYTTVDTSGPDHARVFTVEVHINGKVFGQGEGTSKQAAAQAAAHEALESLGLI
jgi:ribonuclease-3